MVFNNKLFIDINETKDIIFCSKGVAVTTNSDEDIEIIIYHSQEKPKDINFILGTIKVGHQGLTIGNEAIGDKDNKITCNPG